MRDDLDRLLCERYPALFAHRHKPKSGSPICWGFECHDGWFDLINDLCSQIQELVEGGMKQPVCAQVKEKFGDSGFTCEGVPRLKCWLSLTRLGGAP
jgi:hypothetical protein